MDPRYEYDAPLYQDFEDIINGVDSEDVDGWFSRNSHLEKDDLLPSGTCTSAENQLQPLSVDTTSASPPVVKEEQPEEGEGEVPPPTETAASISVKVERESGEEAATVEAPPPTMLGRKRSAPISSLQTPVMKQQKLQRNSSKKAAVAIRSILKPAERHATPEHIRRYLARKQGQVKRTREELEAQEMEKMQTESRKKLREHRKTFHQLTTSGKKPPKMVKTSRPTTESVGFKFRTERRCRQRRSAAAAYRPPQPSGSHTSSFPMTLRSASDLHTEAEGPRKMTEARPFNFRLNSRFPKESTTEGEENKKGYVSMAEYIFKFQAGTPERFRSLPRKKLRSVCATVEETSQSSASSGQAALGGVTMPFTPKLLAKTRARPTLAKSSAELEEEEMAKIKQNPIKAKPVDPKIFSGNGLIGVPKKPRPPSTRPLTPKLATRERGGARAHDGGGATEEGESGERPTFKAQPLPKGLFEKVLGLPKKQETIPTSAKSPAFALNRRNLHTHTDQEKEEERKSQIIVAHPVPDFSKKFEPQLDHKKTEPEPFTFEARYKDKPTRATLVQQILEKEKREPFKANPVPVFEGPILPAVCPQQATEPKTPNLLTRMRGREHQSKWRQTLSEMVRKEKENAEFRAKDAKVLYKSPFRAKTDGRQITEVSNMVLHTELRREQRAEFDKECRNKEEQRERDDRERQEAAEAEEAKRVALLRQRMVHKAQPVRRYVPTVVFPSFKPPTNPHSPKFQLRLRSMH